MIRPPSSCQPDQSLLGYRRKQCYSAGLGGTPVVVATPSGPAPLTDALALFDRNSVIARGDREECALQTVADWLASHGLGEYAACFEENKLDFSVLRDLGEHDLTSLGIPLGHRKKILRAIAALDQASFKKPPLAGTQRARHDGAERRHMTVMFCDLVGSTELSASLDPEHWREVMRAYRNACARAVSTYEGRISPRNFIGDGILIYFGYPRAHENDAERAVRAGLDIVAAVSRLKTLAAGPLRVRVGIVTGLVSCTTVSMRASVGAVSM